MATPSCLGRSTLMGPFYRQVCVCVDLLHFLCRFSPQALPPALAMGHHLGAGTPVCALGYSVHLRDDLSPHGYYRRGAGLGDVESVSSSSHLPRGRTGDARCPLPPTGGPQRKAPAAGAAGRLDRVGGTPNSGLCIVFRRVWTHS